LLHRAARRFAGPGTSLLLTASFVTTPLVQLVTGSLFIENTLDAMILGVMTALWDRRSAWVIALLAGTALSVKVGAMSFLFLALPFLLSVVRVRWKQALAAVALFLLTALPPYAIAWHKTS